MNRYVYINNCVKLCYMKKVSFFINDIATDLIVAINDSPIEPVTAHTWICNNPLGEFWSERDENGFPVLCTYADLFSNNVLSMTDGNGNNPYSTEGSFFVAHPPHAPH